jgi:serine/threonine protein kinase
MGDTTDVKTRTGAILGTPYYMSPEQCQGFNVDPRADVYSLGVILYQMVTGRLPFEAAGLAELLVAHLQRPPPPPRTLEPSLPPTIEAALLQALAKDPEQRFSRVEALITAFTGDTMPDLPPLPPPSARPELGKTSEVFVRVGVRGKRGLLIGGGILAAVVALLVALVVRSPSPTATSATEHSGYGGAWKLSRSDCPAGTMPRQVTIEQSGRSFTVIGGVPTTGEIEPDGKFVTKNSMGTCRGKVTGRVSKETCTNAFKMSCHATYERVD